MRKIIVEIEREKAEYIERLNFELGFAKDAVSYTHLTLPTTERV